MGSIGGSQVLPGNLLQHALLSRLICRALPGSCSCTGFPQTSFWDPPFLLWAPPWPAGASLLHHGHAWAASAWSSSLLLELALGCSLLPSLKYMIPEGLPPPLIDSALASSRCVLKLAGSGSVGHGGIFCQLLRVVTPVFLLLPQPWHKNPVLWYHLTENIFGKHYLSTTGALT